MQGLPCASYIIAFDRMESVIFINGAGKEKQIWQKLTGGQLTAKYTEGEQLQLDSHVGELNVTATLTSWGNKVVAV